MIANPGGQLAPDEIIGRDHLIKDLWRVLQGRSLVLHAERRMGKTSIINKMASAPPPGVLPIKRDLEGVASPIEFVERVFEDVEQHLSRYQQLAGKTRALLSKLSGAEVNGVVKFPPAAAADWKKLLAHTIADLMEHQRAAKPPQRVVFFWDEIPFMLSKIEKAVGPNAAMEVLDELRALRHTHTDLRMVFTGSIGLHHVLAQLKHAGHANDATNDMELRDVPTLHAGDAKRLARMLITGEGIPADDLDSVVTTVADSVDCHAFYIQNLVNRMKSAGTTASVPGVAALLDTCLTDAHDPWHLRHYYERLGTYYNDDSAMCLLVLDTLAVQTAPLPLAVLLNLVKHQRPDAGAEQIRGIVTLLAQDHYLHQDTDGRIRFRYPLIQRWWRLHRGLGS